MYVTNRVVLLFTDPNIASSKLLTNLALTLLLLYMQPPKKHMDVNKHYQVGDIVVKLKFVLKRLLITADNFLLNI